jgi:hypothetical protein
MSKTAFADSWVGVANPGAVLAYTTFANPLFTNS